MSSPVSLFEQRRLFQQFYVQQLRLLENPVTRRQEFDKGRAAKEEVGISLVASFNQNMVREIEGVRNQLVQSLHTSGLYYHPRLAYRMVIQRLGKNPQVLLEGHRKENFVSSIQSLLESYSPLSLVLQGPYIGVRSIYLSVFDCLDQLKSLREGLTILGAEAGLTASSPIAPFGPTSFGWVDLARFARELSLKELYPVADIPKKELGPLQVSEVSVVISDKLFLRSEVIAKLRLI